MHLIGAQRYDFVIFSRSYEILNFRNIRLEGINREYLNQYLQLWKKKFAGAGTGVRSVTGLS